MESIEKIKKDPIRLNDLCRFQKIKIKNLEKDNSNLKNQLSELFFEMDSKLKIVCKKINSNTDISSDFKTELLKIICPEKQKSIQCSICLDYIENSPCKCNNCNNFFHKCCLEKWKKVKNECPICKKNI